MGAFAAFLKRSGLNVTGSDQNVYPPMSDVLKQAGVTLISGYAADNLQKLGSKPDLVVVGNVISPSNPEIQAVIQSGIRYTSLPEAMENLMLPKTRNLVVSGTHGKTTTSSLLAYTLVQCGRDPNYFIGGVSSDLPHSFQAANLEPGSLFVLEGDEYDTAYWDKVPKFNHYLPDDVVLTSVEYDHADIYPTMGHVLKAFEGLLDRIRPGGRLIACLDFAEIKGLLPRAKVPVTTYGAKKESGARYTPGKIWTENRGGSSFNCFEICDYEAGGKVVAQLSIQLPGLHNVLNGIAVWLVCKGLGISDSKIADGMAKFRGVKRRQEERGEVNGVLVIDDFAHHPTAVRETLKALKTKYAGRRMVSVFEPRSATSRRKVFQKDYGEAFMEANEVFIAKPYDQTKINEGDQFSSDQLVDDIAKNGRPAHLMETVDGGVLQVAKACRPGDVVAVLSNGGFGGFIPKLLEALKGAAKGNY